METIRILIAGDFCPEYRPQALMFENRPELVFNEFLEELKKNDLNVVDLECPLLESGVPIRKSGPNLLASPKNIELLNYGKIGLVALANNHIRDYGADGLLNTMRLCHENSIATVGAGKNLAEARAPYLIKLKERRIAFINIAENEWSNTYDEMPGANPLDLISNQNDIIQARRDADDVIVIFHGGNEFYELPSPRIKKVLHYFVDAGATAVISHHTHVSSGYEVYKNAPIFYSTGNFCYDTKAAPNLEWHYGYAVRLILGSKVEFEIIPFVQNLLKPGIHMLDETEKQRFFKRIDELNSMISDDQLLASKFDEYCSENAYRYDLLFEPYRNKVLAYLRKRELIPSLMSKRKKRLFLNIIRCESHRDLLLGYLEKYNN
jgi:poly-gamma-glutamate capsule biosynthesis protein CapA/YwtB (metallophosphatase superfamily)